MRYLRHRGIPYHILSVTETADAPKGFIIVTNPGEENAQISSTLFESEEAAEYAIKHFHQPTITRLAQFIGRETVITLKLLTDYYAAAKQLEKERRILGDISQKLKLKLTPDMFLAGQKEPAYEQHREALAKDGMEWQTKQ